MLRNTRPSRNFSSQLSVSAASLLILFSARKKHGIIFMLATVAGLFCIPDGVFFLFSHETMLTFFQTVLPLPVISFLATTGIYTINDLADVKIDRANNKKRPLSSGLVSKRNALFFIILVYGSAIVLAVALENWGTVFVLVPLIALGPLYSAPRIGLKDRFVLKTLSISAGMILCLLLGATADYGHNKSGQSWLAAWYGALMVGMMTFVTSPYNDLGDTKGDRESGRRTIPIVLGYERTLYLISTFATAMLATSWSMFFLGIVGWPAAACQSVVTVFMIFTAFKTIERKAEESFVRKRHSKLVRLHFLVQAGIILGVLFA
jgi:geranylgeranylglycerol-phosphate geranylgeranyltransferase